jgi:hypothetical protein
MSDLRVESDWPATAHDKGTEASLVYETGCCRRSLEINIQAPAKGRPVETQLWCHAHTRGADAVVSVA